MQIGIVAARDRSAINKPNTELTDQEKESIQAFDKNLLEDIIKKLKAKFKEISIITYGCDDGIPLITKEYCRKEKIQVAELAWFIHGEAYWQKSETQNLYVSRHACMLEIVDFFIIFVNQARYAIVEDLIARLEKLVANTDPREGKAKPYVIIDETGAQVEDYKAEMFM